MTKGTLSLVAAVVLAGCSTAEPPPTPPPSATPNPAATPSPVSVPARLFQGTVDRDALFQRGYRTLEEASELVAGHKHRRTLVDTCDIRPPSEQAITYAVRASWFAEKPELAGLTIEQRILHYEGVRGAEAIGEVKAGLVCRGYDDPRPGKSGARFTLTGDLDLPPLPGVDAQHAFCERNNRQQDPWLRSSGCTVVLARGPFATALRLEATRDVTDGQTRAAAGELAPLLRDALLRA